MNEEKSPSDPSTSVQRSVAFDFDLSRDERDREGGGGGDVGSDEVVADRQRDGDRTEEEEKEMQKKPNSVRNIKISWISIEIPIFSRFHLSTAGNVFFFLVSLE